MQERPNHPSNIPERSQRSFGFAQDDGGGERVFRDSRRRVYVAVASRVRRKEYPYLAMSRGALTCLRYRRSFPTYPMKTLVRGLVLSLGVLLVAGCASSQTARIRQSPQVFGSLTPDQQKLIQAGEVKVGFTADMVYLALGNPSKVLKFKSPNFEADAWIYQRITRRADSTFGGSVSQVDSREWPLSSSNSSIFDGSGMIQAGPYDQGSMQLDHVQTFSLIFREGKVVAIKVVG